MADRVRKIAAELTGAQRGALTTAIDIDGDLHPRIHVRMDVRARLFAKGLIGKRPGHPLTKLGRDVRAHLLETANV